MLRSSNEHHGTTRIHIYTRSPRAPEGVLVQRTPAVAALAVAVILLAYTNSATPSPMIAPEPPQQYVDTTLTAPSGRMIPVPAGGDLRAALNRARPGDVITLEAGATFRGPFTLPNKPGSGWIYVQSSALASLPAPGTRVTPAQASLMPKIVGGSGSAIQTASGAHQYRFIGIEVRPQPGAFVVNLIQLGAGETSAAALPSNMIFDRCYIHGDPAVGGRRGIAMNAASTAVIDSYLSDFKDPVYESNALWANNGPGPFKIVNNYLESAGENVLFGGTDPTIPNLVPSDITITGNYVSKPLSWRVGDPTYAGTAWIVKNLFELKNAQRVLVDGNIFEDNWVQADQHGQAIVFTPRNQNGTAPWSVVQDVTFTRNIVRHTTAGINFLGWDYNFPSQRLQRVLVQNNLFVDVGAFPTNGAAPFPGWLFTFEDGTAYVTIDHNTFFQTNYILYAIQLGQNRPHTGFVFTNNIVPSNQTGVAGDTATGSPLTPLQTLSTYFPGHTFVDNALVGGSASSYPPNNFFPASFQAVGFINGNGPDYHLAAFSPYRRGGTDGKDIGADITALNSAIASWWQTSPRP